MKKTLLILLLLPGLICAQNFDFDCGTGPNIPAGLVLPEGVTTEGAMHPNGDLIEGDLSDPSNYDTSSTNQNWAFILDMVHEDYPSWVIRLWVRVTITTGFTDINDHLGHTVWEVQYHPGGVYDVTPYLATPSFLNAECYNDSETIESVKSIGDAIEVMDILICHSAAVTPGEEYYIN